MEMCWRVKCEIEFINGTEVCLRVGHSLLEYLRLKLGSLLVHVAVARGRDGHEDSVVMVVL